MGAGLESLAALLAHWAVKRADPTTFAESLDAGLAAAEAHDAADPLTRDLDEFVREYLGGRISGEEFVRRLKKPRAKTTGGEGAAASAPLPARSW